MILPGDYLTFEVGEHRCAVHLPRVERVVQALEPDPLPGAPKVVMGVVLIRGEALPVFDPTVRFGEEATPMRLEDHLVVIETERRKVALRVQETHGITKFAPSDLKNVSHLVPELRSVAGVARSPDGTVVIYDVEQFLSREEEVQLDRALQ